MQSLCMSYQLILAIQKRMAKCTAFLAQALLFSLCIASTGAITGKLPRLCLLPIDGGNCTKSYQAYFGYKDGSCVEFSYGGCGGNENRFRTKADCEFNCGLEASKSICSQSLKTGPCRALFKRWGNNNGVCEEFVYGGCDGNDNNFNSKEECEAQCASLAPKKTDVCSLPLAAGPCYALNPSWGYEKGVCKPFNYGGCQGNENRFSSKEDCESQCSVATPKETSICSLPLVVGPCKALIPSWGFEGRACRQFNYGGCRGNENRFRTKEECESRCGVEEVKSVSKDVCSLPLSTGPCRASFKKWGSRNGVCEEFVYGGCDGNDNKFESREECESRCGSKGSETKIEESKSACSLPLATGPCFALLNRWGSKDGVCQEFVYGGCSGNENNFQTKEACEKSCSSVNPCELPAEGGMCMAYFEKWAFINGSCETFVYGGCGGNTNRFDTKEACETRCPSKKLNSQDVCSLPIAAGPCYALNPSWGYENGLCKPFNYGGCQGNENRFSTKEACETRCSSKKLNSQDICSLPLAAGPCYALNPSWGYENGLCKPFNYGGCQGNENRFSSKEDCESQCSLATPKETSICSLPLVVGPCKALIPSWGFEGRACRQFNYGGCRGNENRFRTKEECESKCSSKESRIVPKDVCSLPLTTGPCRALLQKWGSRNGVCEEFVYGGCEGNENRFDTLEACQSKCLPKRNYSKDVCSLPLVAGPCKARKPSWGYENGACKQFNYGGCQGNKNRFSSLKECEKACTSPGRPQDLCLLQSFNMTSVDKSECKGFTTRWVLNPGSNKCERIKSQICLLSTSSQGFKKKTDCEKTCLRT